jgi:phage terminase large subunit-like protein
LVHSVFQKMEVKPRWIGAAGSSRTVAGAGVNSTVRPACSALSASPITLVSTTLSDARDTSGG